MLSRIVSTHSLRSLPFLIFLVAAYLKAAKGVTIEAIYYGAYELGEPAPVIDLSEFVGLLDWLAAADRFTETGDGRPLAALLRAGMPRGLAMRDDLEKRALGKALRYAAEAIEDVALALRVTRPLETMETATHLEAALSQASTAVAARARPFALADPLDRPNWAANLRLQLAMVRWYLDKAQVVQAATLAREWLVSAVAYRVGATSLVDLEGQRLPIEGALNNARRRRAGREVDRPSIWDPDAAALPELDRVVRVWNKVIDLRNDIAHVGMNERPKSASDLRRDMAALLPDLESLAGSLLADDGTEVPKS